MVVRNNTSIIQHCFLGAIGLDHYDKKIRGDFDAITATIGDCFLITIYVYGVQQYLW